VFSLTGLNGSVTVDGRTVTVKPGTSREGDGEATVLKADTIEGAVVWVGVGEGRFSVQYNLGPDRRTDSRGGAPEFLWIRFRLADKEWWDAMASAVMKAARRSSGTADETAAATPAAAVPVDALSAAPPSFDGWLNRTLGLDA